VNKTGHRRATLKEINREVKKGRGGAWRAVFSTFANEKKVAQSELKSVGPQNGDGLIP